MATQSDAINWLNSQVGQHLDYDNAFGQQCVDFFNFDYQWLTGRNPYSDGLGSPAVAGAKDLWDVRVADFTYIPDSSTLVPQPGDIAIYGAAWGAGAGHVEVVVSSDDNGCTFVGENEHNNQNEGVVQVSRTWTQMRGLLGVMRYNWEVPAPPAPAPLYTIAPITPKQVLVGAGHQEWNLNQSDFATIEASPFTTAGDNHVITVVAELHHSQIPQYTYYLEDANNPIGWNALDCTDYIPPPAPVVPVVPPTPPTAPVPYTAAKRYTLKKTLLYFDSALAAQSTQKSSGTLAAGSYYVYSESGDAYNLTTDNMKNQNKWINILDNVIDPAASQRTTDDVIRSFTWFYPTHEPVIYKVVRPLTVQDWIHGGTAISITPGKEIEIYGHFENIYGKTCLRPFTDENDIKNQYYWYGIPTTDIYSGAPYLDNEFNIGEKIRYGFESVLDKLVSFWRSIVSKIKKL